MGHDSAERIKRPRRFHVRKILVWTLVGVIALSGAVIIGSFFVDEPLRRRIEADMNRRLTGYVVTVPEAHFQLFGLAVTLNDVDIRQESHPEPAVVLLHTLRASVQWTALARGRLVANFTLDKPNVYIDLRQLRAEINNDIPIKDEGWQDAFQAIYPLKINLLTITNGTFTYLDQNPKEPLRFIEVNLEANNIENVRSDSGVFPSPVHIDAVVFGTGHAAIDGNADFLVDPLPAVRGRFTLTDVPLNKLQPVAERANVIVRRGLVTGSGTAEFTPDTRIMNFDDITVSGINVDFVQGLGDGITSPSLVRTKSVGTRAPGDTAPLRTELRVNHVRLVDGTLGILNRGKNPNYRLFVSRANGELSEWSNKPGGGNGRATFTGKFMGTGATHASATFNYGDLGQNFALRMSIAETPMPAMNDLFRAYGNFDVARGEFAMNTEVNVKDQVISGYVKPLFRDVKIYSSHQEKGKNELRKLYERVLDLGVKLLQNGKRDEIATVARLHGRGDNPNMSFWQVFGRVLENAFVKEIVPGFLRRSTPARPATE